MQQKTESSFGVLMPSIGSSPKNKNKSSSFEKEIRLKMREKQYDFNLSTKTTPNYQPLTDKFLTDYFHIPIIRKHLIRQGLINEEGAIVDESRFKEMHLRLDRREHDELERMKLIQRQLEEELQNSTRYENVSTDPRIPSIGKLKIPRTTFSYPEHMRNTALIYTQKPVSLIYAERALKERLKENSNSSPAKKTPPVVELTEKQLAMKKNEEARDAYFASKKIWRPTSVNPKYTTSLIDKKLAKASKKKQQKPQNNEVNKPHLVTRSSTYSILDSLKKISDQNNVHLGDTVDKVLKENNVQLDNSAERYMMKYIQALGGNLDKVIKHISSSMAETTKQEKSERKRPRAAKPHRQARAPSAGSAFNNSFDGEYEKINDIEIEKLEDEDNSKATDETKKLDKLKNASQDSFEQYFQNDNLKIEEQIRPTSARENQSDGDNNNNESNKKKSKKSKSKSKKIKQEKNQNQHQSIINNSNVEIEIEIESIHSNSKKSTKSTKKNKSVDKFQNNNSETASLTTKDENRKKMFEELKNKVDSKKNNEESVESNLKDQSNEKSGNALRNALNRSVDKLSSLKDRIFSSKTEENQKVEKEENQDVTSQSN